MIKTVRDAASLHIPQMTHCARCRADAVGLVGEKTDEKFLQEIKACSQLKPEKKFEIKPPSKEKPYIACASHEGVLVNQHLGEAEKFWVFGEDNKGIKLVDVRKAPSTGNGENRWEELCQSLSDCSYVLVNGVGGNPRKILEKNGLSYHVVEGVIDNVVGSIYQNKSISHLIKREMTKCGDGCSGGSVGCG